MKCSQFREFIKGGEKFKSMISKTRIASVVSAGALLLSSFATTAFATTTSTSLEISGNGSFSESEIISKTSQDKTVVQDNDTRISNTLNASANSGGNTGSFNTNGDTTIDTGNATTFVDVVNKAGLNIANVEGCCVGDQTAQIARNGAGSDNDIKLKNNTDTNVFQSSNAWINNDIWADSNSGENAAKYNTGGNNDISTGHASTGVFVTNKANANIARVGGEGGAGSLHARILDNGAFSDSEIKVLNRQSTTIVQDNDAWFSNFVWAKSNTGHNKAKNNTGGSNSIWTGNAHTLVDVLNKANFNWVATDCGCVTNLSAKVAGNGSFADSDIFAALHNDRHIFQGGEGAGNLADFFNWVNSDASSGWNKAKGNTGSSHSDPEITTGHARSEQLVTNKANVNIVGGLSGLPDFSFGFDLGPLISFLH